MLHGTDMQAGLACEHVAILSVTFCTTASEACRPNQSLPGYQNESSVCRTQIQTVIVIKDSDFANGIIANTGMIVEIIIFFSLHSAQAVWEAGAGSQSANQQWHFRLDPAPTLPTAVAQQAVCRWPAAAAVLLWAVWGQHHHADQCHWCFLLIHQQQSATQDLCRSQQVCHPQCP